jgi:DNA repair protein RadB
LSTVRSTGHAQWRIQLKSADEALPSRCEPLDALLGGGFTAGDMIVVYGEAGTGKTTLAMQTAIEAARRGSKVIYVDADRSFTHQRFIQLAGEDSDAISERILLFFPETFAAQTSLIENIENYLAKMTRLVVVDAVTSLYRVSLGSAQETFTLNRELNRQLAYLNEVALRHRLVVLLTSQVHARMDFPFGRIEPVARRTLAHWPRTVIRMKNTSERSRKDIVLERHRGRAAGSFRCSALLTARGLEHA